MRDTLSVFQWHQCYEFDGLWCLILCLPLILFLCYAFIIFMENTNFQTWCLWCFLKNNFKWFSFVYESDGISVEKFLSLSYFLFNSLSNLLLKSCSCNHLGEIFFNYILWLSSILSILTINLFLFPPQIK